MLNVEAWFAEMQQAGNSPASLVYVGDDSYGAAWRRCYELRKLHTDLSFSVSVRLVGDGTAARVVYSYPKKESI